MTEVYHALGLHMHQPPNNLRLLIETNEWEARHFLRETEQLLQWHFCYRRQNNPKEAE
jgi:hypothetical protein